MAIAGKDVYVGIPEILVIGKRASVSQKQYISTFINKNIFALQLRHIF
jgi:hypothetical protein